MSRPVAVPLDRLAEVQHTAADGGMIHSSWYTRKGIFEGDLVRHASGWAVIAGIEQVARRGGTVYAVTLRDAAGQIHTQYLYTHNDGMEVRLDTRIGLTAVPA